MLEALKGADHLADVLVENLPKLAPAYSKYCAGIPAAQAMYEKKLLMKEFVAFEASFQNLNKPTLNYVMRPVQRIMKYPLLIMEIKKVLKEDVAAVAKLEVAMEAATELANVANSSMNAGPRQAVDIGQISDPKTFQHLESIKMDKIPTSLLSHPSSPEPIQQNRMSTASLDDLLFDHTDSFNEKGQHDTLGPELSRVASPTATRPPIPSVPPPRPAMVVSEKPLTSPPSALSKLVRAMTLHESDVSKRKPPLPPPPAKAAEQGATGEHVDQSTVNQRAAKPKPPVKPRRATDDSAIPPSTHGSLPRHRANDDSNILPSSKPAVRPKPPSLPLPKPVLNLSGERATDSATKRNSTDDQEPIPPPRTYFPANLPVEIIEPLPPPRKYRPPPKTPPRVPSLDSDDEFSPFVSAAPIMLPPPIPETASTADDDFQDFVSAEPSPPPSSTGKPAIAPKPALLNSTTTAIPPISNPSVRLPPPNIPLPKPALLPKPSVHAAPLHVEIHPVAKSTGPARSQSLMSTSKPAIAPKPAVAMKPLLLGDIVSKLEGMALHPSNPFAAASSENQIDRHSAGEK